MLWHGKRNFLNGLCIGNIMDRTALIEKHQWLVFLLPFVVFMLVTALEPTAPEKPGGAAIGLNIPYAAYPWVYTAKIVLTMLAVVFVLPGYRQFPFRVSPLAPLVGVVGIFVWVGLCKLHLEAHLWTALNWEWTGQRSGFNPFGQFPDQPVAAWSFLAVRFVGLVAVVAVIEEFFLRGFVMRFVVDADWWKVPFGKVNATAVIAGTAVPMLMHPGELLAAAVWFSMMTWLMVHTRNIWDCVVAHAVTNLLLGLYVVFWDDWTLM